jgi:hypothetical protein
MQTLREYRAYLADLAGDDCEAVQALDRRIAASPEAGDEKLTGPDLCGWLLAEMGGVTPRAPAVPAAKAGGVH